MDETATLNLAEGKNDIAEEQSHIHEYYFEYNTESNTPLTECLIDILAFVLDCPQNEAEQIFDQKCSSDVNHHFAMLDQLAKSELVVWIGSHKFIIDRSGEIVIREFN